MSWPTTLVTTLTLVTLFAGCNPPDEDTSGETGDTGATDTDEQPPLALIGAWAELGGTFPDRAVWGYHTIDATAWVDAFGAAYLIASYDASSVIAQNNDANSYYPGQWSRFDYVADGAGGFFYCQSAYAAATEEDAAATPAADATDPATGGCGTFAWSHLVPVLPIDGEWNDGFVDHVIDEAAWTMGTDTFAVATVSLDGTHLVAQNGAENAWNAGLWSRFDWHFDGADLYYCQTAYDAASAEAAEAAESDASDLATGCGGFPWSALSPIAD